MTKQPPVVYFLHGEDEYASAQFVANLEARLGDPGMVATNVSRFDGRTYNQNDLIAAVSAMPFLAKRRIVVLTHPLARLRKQEDRQRFIKMLEGVPDSTALVLIEYRMLTKEWERRKGKVHWLEKWAQERGDSAYIKSCKLKKGSDLAHWIILEAQKTGGKFSPQAAGLLASLVGENPRQAKQEIEKLLDYVDYQRPVEAEDVEKLTADTGQADIFDMVDALGNKNGQVALQLLQRLLDERDTISIFGMVVRQFRLLIQVREIMDQGGMMGEIAGGIKVPYFVAEKLVQQARGFDLRALEEVYHRLLDLDEGVKSGRYTYDLGLVTFVSEFTSAERVVFYSGRDFWYKQL
jgi:DNA polymerase-3 subunit delta